MNLIELSPKELEHLLEEAAEATAAKIKDMVVPRKDVRNLINLDEIVERVVLRVLDGQPAPAPAPADAQPAPAQAGP